MLAQTQVNRVVPKWEAFLARWPDPAACAASPVSEVIAAWSGLGYNRRAVQLHRAAATIVERHGGQVPSDLAGLLALPGVGPYTARAVLAFAFDRPVAVVDTNVARVMARAVGGRSLTAREVQALADSLVPVGRGGWAWNQAMLDLGATVCTGRRPACDRCPLGPDGLQPGCRWAVAGGPDPAPGSARVSTPQARFAGSDRQGRGRLVAALTALAPGEYLPTAEVAAAAGWPGDPARADAVATRLVTDGLAVAGPDGSLALP
jgi:A/G-specific adenine glycosylase